jgi:hypothetical protein
MSRTTANNYAIRPSRLRCSRLTWIKSINSLSFPLSIEPVRSGAEGREKTITLGASCSFSIKGLYS